ncbi:MAG TPA: DNA-3-methyladenine glycosylase [Bacteroidales bacterium]|nr:DNA-3-methyladenine glycosylase [Bacteroidales bacterium]HNS46762.1 DNA-3-methyladenine glycosylase [Bacteroidales bacterium]
MGRQDTIVLDRSFYTRDDVNELARLLLGKVLFTRIGNQLAGGMITETEAYRGIHDRASHAYGGRMTKRTRVMYAGGGVAYVYLCYGIHSLFNVVTNVEDIPDAILVRGIAVTHGCDVIAQRLDRKVELRFHLAGPGLVSRALGITTGLTGLPLVRSKTGDALWIEDRGVVVSAGQMVSSPRIGVDYAGPDAALPYRYLWSP